MLKRVLVSEKIQNQFAWVMYCVSFNFQKYQTPQNDGRKKNVWIQKPLGQKNTDTLHTCILPTDLSTFLLTFYQHST